MTSPLTTKIDTSNFTARTRLWAKSSGLSFRDGLRKQAGLLIRDLVNSSAPRNLARAKKLAEREVKQVFRAAPPQVFVGDKRGHGRMVWLYAHPRALTGVATEDFQTGIGPDEMKEAFYLQKFKRGIAWRESGTRGKQHVLWLNRIVVRRMAAFIKKLRDRFGLLKASWAVGWDVLNVAGRLPDWVRKHVRSGEARGVLVNGLANAERPFLNMISTANGVERRASLVAIRLAVRRRQVAMLRDIRYYLDGTKKKSGLK